MFRVLREAAEGVSVLEGSPAQASAKIASNQASEGTPDWGSILVDQNAVFL